MVVTSTKQVPAQDETTANVYAQHGSGPQIIQGQGGNQNIATGSGHQFLGAIGNAFFGEVHEKPKPRVTISFYRDKNFIGRDSILREIECQLQSNNNERRVALIGPSGVGKTQIAIEYGYRLHEKASQTWVFWVNASSAETFNRSYADIANNAKIPGRNDEDVNILHLVHQWFLNTSEDWLLIIDNNDNGDVLSRSWPKIQKSGDQNRLATYIPSSQTGSVIFTTRNENAVSWLCECSIDVKEMSKSEAKVLFNQTLKENAASDDSVDSLLEYLDYLPLGITQATAYINTTKGYTPQKYFNLLKQKPIQYLKRFNSTDLRRYDVPSSVIGSLQLTFQSLRDLKNGSDELLYIISFLSQQDIPEEIIKVCEEEWGEDNWNVLLAHRLVEQEKSGKSYKMRHRLVPLSVKDWLEDQGWRKDQERREDQNAAQKYASLALKAACNLFPEGDTDDHDLCQKLVLHTSHLVDPENLHGLSVNFNSDEDSKVKAELLRKAGLYRSEMGDHQHALDWFEEASTIRMEKLGPKHLDTIYSMNDLALAYSDLGNFAKAIPIQLQVVEALELKKKTGECKDEELPYILQMMGDLSGLYKDAGQFVQAEKVAEQAVKAADKIPRTPETVPEILRVKMLLVQLYTDMSKQNLLDLLLKLEKDEAEALEENEGNDQIDFALYRSQFAMIYRANGKFDDAERCMESAIKTLEKKCDPRDPQTLARKSDLALIYTDEGKFQEAKKLLDGVLEISKVTHGENHLDTLRYKNNLAWVFQRTGQLEKAEELSKEVVKEVQKTLDEKHPTTLKFLNTLATTYRLQGNLKDAAELGKMILLMRESTLGKNHRDTLLSLSNLALVYHKQGRHSEMRELLRPQNRSYWPFPGINNYRAYYIGICMGMCFLVLLVGRISGSL